MYPSACDSKRRSIGILFILIELLELVEIINIFRGDCEENYVKNYIYVDFSRQLCVKEQD